MTLPRYLEETQANRSKLLPRKLGPLKSILVPGQRPRKLHDLLCRDYQNSAIHV